MAADPLECCCGTQLRIELERLGASWRGFLALAGGHLITAFGLAVDGDPKRGNSHQLLRNIVERGDLTAFQFELDLGDRQRPLLLGRDYLPVINRRLNLCAWSGGELNNIATKLGAEDGLQLFEDLGLKKAAGFRSIEIRIPACDFILPFAAREGSRWRPPITRLSGR